MQSHIQMNEYRDRVILVRRIRNDLGFMLHLGMLYLLVEFIVANRNKKEWKIYWQVREGFRYEWPKAFSIEPD